MTPVPIRPGDPLFYPATMAMGLVWTGGALAAGWWIRFRRETVGHVVAGLVVGLGLLVLFLLGAGLVARIPLLAEPVDTLLAHARWGSLPAVLAITVINAVAEELFLRARSSTRSAATRWCGRPSPTPPSRCSPASRSSPSLGCCSASPPPCCASAPAASRHPSPLT